MKIVKILFVVSLINFILLFGVWYWGKSNDKESLKTDQTVTISKCLVTIKGVLYDLEEFKKLHSGGDIFECGKDMTQTLLNQHPESYISQLEKYRVK